MTTRYGRSALRAECANVGAAREGGREKALSLAAGHVGELVAGGEVSEADAASELTYAAQATGLGSREIRVTIEKGLKRGARNPRGGANSARVRDSGSGFDWSSYGEWMRDQMAAFDASPDSAEKRYALAGGRCRPCYESNVECFHRGWDEGGLESWALN